MLSTDSPFTAADASFFSSIKHPLASFYRPSPFDLSATNFSNKYHHFGDGSNFFGKLTTSQFDTTGYDPPLTSNRYRFREFYTREQDPQLSDRFLKNLDNSIRNDRIRYNPYSSASNNQRLRKILYKSVTNIDDLSPLPNKYAGYSIQDKLAHLKKTIGGLDTTNLWNKENSAETPPAKPPRNIRYLDRSAFATALPKRFSPPTITSTPTLRLSQMDYPLKPPKPLGIRRESEENKIVAQTMPEETPSSSRKGSISTTSKNASQEATWFLPTGLSSIFRSVQQLWRGRKFSDDNEYRRKEAQNLEKELRLREKSRHNRQLTEEENRRIRLQLEGLVLERRVPPKEEFPELSKAARQIVGIIWTRSEPNEKVFVNGFGANITRKDLLSLSGLEWLNDEVINFFLNLVVERNNNEPNLPNVYTFNTFFYQKLQSNGFAGVKRWTRKVDIFSHEILIVPVHLPNHWCMAIIDLKEKRLDYYDSLMGSNEKCLQSLSDYLAQESLDKRKRPFDLEGWTMECRKDIPRQNNFSDCGMFSCLFAEYASRRAPITFTQKHISYFRERMCYEICQKKLL